MFSNGTHEREITHSDNEFLITIPRKSNQVTNQESAESNQERSYSIQNSNQEQEKNNQVSNQPQEKSNQPIKNLVTRKLTKKEEDIRNFCSVPRTAKEIMDRLNITNQSKNRQKYITSLIDLGVLERTIPDTPNDPNQNIVENNRTSLILSKFFRYKTGIFVNFVIE